MRNTLLPFSQKLSAIATTRNILILLACWLGFQLVLANASEFIKSESSGTNVIDLAIPFSFSPQEAYTQYLDKYSPVAREFYLKIECLDLLYPICYGLFFSCLISLGFKNTKYHWLNLQPMYAIFFDYLENIGVFTLLLKYPQQDLFMAGWTGIFGGLKWIFAFLSLLAILASLGKKVAEKWIKN